MAGWISKARITLGGELLMLGSRIHLALGDLGMWVEPRLAADERPGRRIRPWLGLVVIALLALGLLAAGDIGLVLVREALPHREQQP